MANKPQVIVHRGGGFLAPENTIEAMKIGLELPVDGIEIDVLFTKDDVPIVYHDRSLKRTTNIRRQARKTRYNDLKDLDNGSWFDPAFSSSRIPTLDSFLNEFAHRRQLYLEVKETGQNLLAIPQLINEHGMLEDTIFLSFHYQALLDIKEAYPEATTMFLLGARWNRPVEYVLDERIDWFGLSFQLAHKKPKYLKKLLDFGYPINIWSCNDMDIARKLISMGITSITTDKPQEMLELIKSSLPR